MAKRHLYLLAVAIISLLVIFFNFPNYPKNIAHDETEIVRAALSIANKPFTIFTPEADGHTTLYLYILLGSFNLFGLSNFAMRLPVAFFSVLNVLLFFLILDRVLRDSKYKFEIACAGSLLMLTSHWFINFSRFSFEIPFLLCLELISLFFLLVILERSDRVPALKDRDSIVTAFLQNDIGVTISAIFAGLAFNSYQPGRIFFLVPLFYLLINKYYKKAIKFLVVFGIVVLPLCLYLLTNNTNDIRINQQLYLTNNKLSIEQKTMYFSENVIKNLGVFSVAGDKNGRHNFPGKPALNPILAILMYFGIFVSILNFRKNNFHKLFLVYFVVAIFPTLLTLPNENPNMLRTYTMLPAVFYFIAVALSVLYEISRKVGKPESRKVFLLFVLSLLLFSTYKELKTYFVDQSVVFQKSFEYSKTIEQIYRYQ